MDTYTAPSLIITELREDLLGWSLVTHDPQDNEDGEEGEHMDNQHATFERRKSAKQHCVEDGGEKYGSDSQ